jgi:ketosteroid isomerase-like protein
MPKGRSDMPSVAGETALRGAEHAVWQVVEAFNRAFVAGDVERYFAFIDEEITVLTPANPYRVEGIADDREEFEWGLRAGTGRVGYFQELQPVVRVSGEMALVTYYSRGSYGGANEGSGKTLYLKETDVLIRRQDGWKILHIHVSAS